MSLVNKTLTGLFDLLFLPFRSLGPWWALVVFSLLTGILMLWIFGKVSNQDAIRVIRDRIRANLIAIRLYGDDIGLLFRLQGRILRDTAVYLKFALVPLLVMLVPVLVILVQLNLRFEARPLRPGEPVLIKVTVWDAALIDRGVSLEVPQEVVVETPGVRVASLREVSWRIRADQPGRFRLVARADGEEVEKELVVGGDWAAVSTLRTGKNFWEKVLYPGEAPIAGTSAVESVQVRYAGLPLRLFGWNIHWLLAFFVLSIASGFAFRRVLGVEI